MTNRSDHDLAPRRRVGVPFELMLDDRPAGRQTGEGVLLDDDGEYRRPIRWCPWADRDDGCCTHPAKPDPECWVLDDGDRPRCPPLDDPVKYGSVVIRRRWLCDRCFGRSIIGPWPNWLRQVMCRMRLHDRRVPMAYYARHGRSDPESEVSRG